MWTRDTLKIIRYLISYYNVAGFIRLHGCAIDNGDLSEQETSNQSGDNLELDIIEEEDAESTVDDDNCSINSREFPTLQNYNEWQMEDYLDELNEQDAALEEIRQEEERKAEAERQAEEKKRADEEANNNLNDQSQN